MSAQRQRWPALRAEPGIAVVVPVLNEERQFPSLLEHLARLGAAEIVVVDGGSSDRTPHLAGGARHVRVISSERGRGQQIAAGVAVTTAPIVIVLHADTRLPTGALDLVRAALADRRVVAGCFRIAFDDTGVGLALFAWLSRFESALTTFGDQAFFMRRDALEAIGGVPLQPLFEDVELRRRLRRAGKFLKLGACVETSARRFKKAGAMRAMALMVGLHVAHRVGVSPITLARWYDTGR